MKNPIKNAINSLMYDRKHFLFAIIVRIGFLFPNDRLYLKLLYLCNFGRNLNLKYPILFSEKLQWLKLYNHNPHYTTLVDKCLVKSHVSKVIGDKYIIPTLAVYKDIPDINLDKLPDSYVLKTNHDSGSSGVLVVHNSNNVNKHELVNKISKSFHRSSYVIGREWPYKNIKKCIFAEKYIVDKNDQLLDYKFFCFNGKVRCFKVDFDRATYHRANYFDRDGKLLPFGESEYPPDFNKKIVIPTNVDEMICIAELLSKDIPFVRIDLYNVDGKIYFGEFTFFPAGGMTHWTNDKTDELLGGWLDISDVTKQV